MHDIGKVTTPVEIIEKSTKLETIFDRIQMVDMRMRYLIQKTRFEGIQAQMAVLQNGGPAENIKELEMSSARKIEELEQVRSFLLECNQPSEFLDDEKLARLKQIAQMTYLDDNGQVQPFLTSDELLNLSIRKGSINENERQIMKNHAQITLDMLNRIPFTKKLKNIPFFAGAHHEFLNGKGYPLGLKGDDIPFEGKLMAVTDIAEALTASDRPYKKAMPLEEVYKILRMKVERQELDHDLVEFFINFRIYEKYQAQFEGDTHPSQGKSFLTNPKES